MVADTKPTMAQDQELPIEAAVTPRKTFKDYVKGYGASMAGNTRSPLSLKSIGRELVHAVTDFRQKAKEESTHGNSVTPQQTFDERLAKFNALSDKLAAQGYIGEADENLLKAELRELIRQNNGQWQWPEPHDIPYWPGYGPDDR